MHRRFSLAQKISGSGRDQSVEDRDAYRSRHDDFLIGNAHRRAQRAAHRIGKARQFARVVIGHQQHGKPVASNPAKCIVRPEVLGEAARDGQQQAIADHRPERTVDALEPVEIDIEDRRRHQRLGAGSRNRNAETVEEQRAVR